MRDIMALAPPWGVTVMVLPSKSIVTLQKITQRDVRAALLALPPRWLMTA
jgi:hypothetical protein